MITTVRKAITFVAAGLALFFLAVSVHDSMQHSSFVASNGGDFKEFYCAEEAVLEGADPYRVEPLRSCEHRVAIVNPAWLVVPAPLPGYSFAAFLPFAKLPFGLARLAWEAMIVTSVLIAAVALAALTSWPPFLILLVLIPTDGFLNLTYGELPPFVTAALCVGALALKKGFVSVPAICAGIALFEPHLGLPAVIALAIAIPGSRKWMIGILVALAIASVTAIGLGANIEYFRSVLPLQAAAEVVANDQYSLTRLLSMFNVSPGISLAAGSASFAIMVVVGVTIAVLLAKRGRPEYLLLLPPAAVVLGGSYIHDVQLSVAIPLALLLAADSTKVRPWAFGAIALLLLPATSHKLASYPLSAISALAAMLALGVILIRTRPLIQRIIIISTQAFAIVIVCAWLWSARHDPRPVASTPVESSATISASTPLISDRDFAPTVWGTYLRRGIVDIKPNMRFIVEKIPAWVGLIIVLGCGVFVLEIDPSKNATA